MVGFKRSVLTVLRRARNEGVWSILRCAQDDANRHRGDKRSPFLPFTPPLPGSAYGRFGGILS